MVATKYNLEDRLVAFAISIIKVCEKMPNTRVANNLEYQLSKSGTAPALLYGEALSAESRNDFIHKMKIGLKELRETRINLRIIKEKPLVTCSDLDRTFMECNELIAIFTSSIQTAKKNNIKEKT